MTVPVAPELGAGHSQTPKPYKYSLADRLYLPLLLEGHYARRAGRSFVLAHYAQTLDDPEPYLRDFNRAVSKRLSEYALEIENR